MQEEFRSKILISRAFWLTTNYTGCLNETVLFFPQRWRQQAIFWVPQPVFLLGYGNGWGERAPMACRTTTPEAKSAINISDPLACIKMIEPSVLLLRRSSLRDKNRLISIPTVKYLRSKTIKDTAFFITTIFLLLFFESSL